MSTLQVYCVFLTLLTSASSRMVVTFLSQSPVQVKRGDSVTITAKIENIPSDISSYIIGWDIKSTFAGIQGLDVDVFRNEFKRHLDIQTGLVNLTIMEAKLAYDGVVSLHIQGDGVPLYKEDVDLVVLVPPATVNMELLGGAVEEGKTSNISCEATNSNPAVDISWFRNGLEIQGVLKSTPVEDLFTTQSYLSVRPTSDSMGDEYKCVVSGDSLESPVSRLLTLNVLYAPKIDASVPPVGSYQVAGTEVTFSCVANANPSDVTWQWSLGDEVLSDGVSGTYTYSSISADLNGKELRCEASNSKGSGKHTFPLKVYYPPEFTTTPTNVQVDLDGSIALHCRAIGNPEPVITWSKMNIDSSYRIVANKEAFEIASLEEEDFGKYRCSAAAGTEHFDTLEAEFHVLKKDRPGMTNRAEAVIGYNQGQDATLTCKAICVPEPTAIMWYKGKDREPIDLSSSRYSTTTEQTLDIVVNILSIKDLASTDFDFYNCTVINERGMDSAIYTLEQTNDFPWKWALGVIGGVIVICIIIAVVVRTCRRSQTKTSSAGSLSMVSNTTDNSIRKPTEGIIPGQSTSLPEYGMRPIDMWKNNDDPNDSNVFDASDYGQEPKPELYSSYAPNACTTFSRNAYPAGNFGSYRVEHPQETVSAPPYSTLPIRPARMPEVFNRSRAPYVDDGETFHAVPAGNTAHRSPYVVSMDAIDGTSPVPPPGFTEPRLATNV